MNLQLQDIDKGNYQECIRLTVSDTQRGYVAANIKSLVEAAYEPDLYPLGVYEGKTMIGFVLFDFDKSLNGWSLSRFMIGSQYQGKGYGKAALSVFLSYFRAKFGDVPLFTSVALNNGIAAHLYESFGFQRQDTFEYEFEGVMHREVRMVLELV